MAEQRGQQWHLDKTFSVSHLITTLAMASSIFVWAMKMDARVSVVESQQTYTKENEGRIEAQMRDSLKEVSATLVRIEQKLDGKADRRK